MNEADLVSFWHKCPSDPPFVHPDDLSKLAKGDLGHLDFDKYIAGLRFTPTDSGFHFSLLPVPYVGSMASADIFVLGLNPGFEHGDYYAECCVPEFHRRLVANLRQEPLEQDYPFFYLDPRFCWHPGFGWWERKFRDIVTGLTEMRPGYSYHDGPREVSRRLLAIELVPYHSKQFSGTTKLASSEQARAFVRNALIPRAEKDEALIVLTRSYRRWSLPMEHVLSCENPQNPSMSKESEVGKKILDYLRTHRTSRAPTAESTAGL